MASCQVQPSAEFPPRLKFACGAQASEQCSCGEYADSFNPGQGTDSARPGRTHGSLSGGIADMRGSTSFNRAPPAEDFGKEAAQLIFHYPRISSRLRLVQQVAQA